MMGPPYAYEQPFEHIGSVAGDLACTVSLTALCSVIQQVRRLVSGSSGSQFPSMFT